MACVAYGCDSHSSKKTEENRCVSFHRFPVDDNYRKIWIKALRRNNWEPTKYSRLCSNHFAAECYIPGLKRKTLRTDAVPTIFEGYPAYYISESSKQSRLQKFDLQRNIEFSTPSTSTASPSQSLEDTPRKKKLKKLIVKEKILSARRRVKLKNLQQKCRRMTKKIETLENIIKDLKDKSLINAEWAQVLSEIGGENEDFLRRYVAKKTGQSLPREYSPELRKFAVTLNFLSPRAYSYVRQQFTTVLPHPSTISKWYASVDCKPGFSSESLNTIKQKSKGDKKIFCALSVDGMAIRKIVEWDATNYHGYVDVGNQLQGENVLVAKEALVFMLTSLNENWKVPVAYFLIDGITGLQLSTLVKQCIRLLNECDIELCSITFDGLPANLAMATELGCSFNVHNLKTTFEFDGKEIAVLLDPCHNIKLIRNTFAEHNNLTDVEGGIISWEYVKKLHDLQTMEGLHAANKVRNQHIAFEKQKMKVKLAVQVLSESVADALDLCRESNIAGFEDSTATSRFIRIFNNLFDIFNSRSMKAKGFKKPIALFNASEVWNVLDDAEVYIRGLKLPNNVPIVTSKRKTGFLGFLVCMKSIKSIYSRFVSPTSDLKYLTTYKMSQDHLELFFSAIRAKGGHNNNPSARQFRSAFKRLLVHAQFKNDSKGNCIPLEEIHILTSPSSDKYICDINKSTMERYKLLENEMPISNTNGDHDYFFDPSQLTEFADTIVQYIAGFVVRKIKKILFCQVCVDSLETKKTARNRLTHIKDKGGLIHASPDVINICKTAEKVLKKYIHIFGSQQLGLPKNLFILIKETFANCTNCFEHLVNHSTEQWRVDNHRNLIIKSIAETYFITRIHYITKLIVQPEERVRNYLNKTVLFKGQ